MIPKNKMLIPGAVLFFILALFPVFSGCSGKNNEMKEQSNGKTKEEIAVESLKPLLKDYPSSIRDKILSNPGDFLSLMERALELPPEIFIMADKTHALGEDFIPEDLVMLKDYPQLAVSRNNHSLRKIVIHDLLRMCSDVRKEGLTLLISSTYRSYSYQKMLFEREVKLYGLETAERESARPGTSQHQLGVTVDFGSISDDYARTPPGKWLMENAWKYGFSLSYPEGYEWLTGYRPEVWHYRYITPAGTELQRKYFDDVQQYMLMFINNNRTELSGIITAFNEAE